MGQPLSVFSAFIEDPGLNSSIHMAAPKDLLREYDALFWSLWALHTCGTQIRRQTLIYIK